MVGEIFSVQAYHHLLTVVSFMIMCKLNPRVYDSLLVLPDALRLYRVYRQLRRVHTMKVMRIESELIRIACVHTECALTAIRIQCAFTQSTSRGGLKPV